MKKDLQATLQNGKNNAKVLFLVNVDKFDTAALSKCFETIFENEYAVEWLPFSKRKKKWNDQTKACFGTKDFSYNGNISTEKLKDVLQQDYEYVFQFFNKKHFYLNYLSSLTKANLRIGFEDAEPKLTDLLFKFNKTDLDLFFKEAKKYLNAIKKST